MLALTEEADVTLAFFSPTAKNADFLYGVWCDRLCQPLVTWPEPVPFLLSAVFVSLTESYMRLFHTLSDLIREAKVCLFSANSSRPLSTISHS